MRILLVEDNKQLGKALKQLLDPNYAVDHISTGEDALSAALSHSYDLLILDLSLPDMDGLDVLRQVRSERRPTPVLILTARDKLDDRIAGLDLGADDYMTKPFELSELEARIRALLRRVSLEKTSRMTLGELIFDLSTNTIEADGKILDLSARERSILRVLMMASDRIVSKAHLLEAITSFDGDVSENAVEQYVSRLRKKLAPHGLAINAARGLGYHLRQEN